MRLTCVVEFVKKDLWVTDEKSGLQKRKASKTKNEMFQEMVKDCTYKCRFDYVLADSWFSSVENMQTIQGEGNIDLYLH